MTDLRPSMPTLRLAFVALLAIGVAATGCDVFGGGNSAPSISNIQVDPVAPPPGVEATVTAEASDPDGDGLSYQWSASDGSFQGDTATENPASWVTPTENGTYEITCTVDDGSASTSMTISVDVGRQRN